MIIRPKYNWVRLLFVWNGSVLPDIFPRLLAIFTLSAMVLYFHGVLFSVKVSLNSTPFTLMGIALAIFLGFRNSAAYDRFWEGRKLWGALLNTSRSLARQSQSLLALNTSAKDLQHFNRLIIAFSFALKHQLRHTDPDVDLKRLLPPDVAQRIHSSRFRPSMILHEMGQWLKQQKAQGNADSITLMTFDKNLNDLSDILGGCERISNTPIPYPYAVLLHRTVYIYCILLPFGLVDSIDWMTPFICTFVAYTFMAMDAIILQIEEPFGLEDNDLALNFMTENLECSIREIGGEKVDLPSLAADQYQIT